MLGASSGLRPKGHSKRNFVTLVFFCLICSRQDHPGDAILEYRLMEVDEQSNQDIQ